MTDFKNGQELLEVCKKKRCPISEVMNSGRSKAHPPPKKKWKIRCEKPSPS